MNARSAFLFALLAVVAFFGLDGLPLAYALTLGALVVAVGGAYSLYHLVHLVPSQRIPRPLLRLCGVRPADKGAT